MTRRVFLAVPVGTFLGSLGCQGSSPSGSQRTSSKAELEAELAERLKLRDVVLNDQGGGRFTGTGTDDQDRTVELEATQEERRLSWKTKVTGPNGGSGSSGGYGR